MMAKRQKNYQSDFLHKISVHDRYNHNMVTVGLVEPVRLLQPWLDQYFLLTLEQSLMQAEHNVGRASLHTKYVQTALKEVVSSCMIFKLQDESK